MEGGEIIIKAFRSHENWMILRAREMTEKHLCADVIRSQCDGKEAPGEGGAPAPHLAEHQHHMNIVEWQL